MRLFGHGTSPPVDNPRLLGDTPGGGNRPAAGLPASQGLP